MRSRGFDEDDIDSVIDQLSESGLQSDDRYTESYIASRTEKGSGPIRIRAELRERGVAESVIEYHLEAYAESWPALLRKVHDMKYGPETTCDRKAMAKRARFLEYRGFPTELIRDFLFN
ncbi:MAG: regulatory protein RecX [Candidatus Thiodiazotropha sp.]